MKNNVWTKTLNLILALAMLLGNAPASWALRPNYGKNMSSTAQISDELKGPRGSANGYIIQLEHKILNKYIVDNNIRSERYRLRPKDLPERLKKKYPFLENLLELLEAYVDPNLPLLDHYAIRDGVLYVRSPELLPHIAYEYLRLVKYGFAEFGTTDAIKAYGSKIVIENITPKEAEFELLVKWFYMSKDSVILPVSERQKTLEELVKWMDRKGDSDGAAELLTAIHNSAPEIPPEFKYFIPTESTLAIIYAVKELSSRYAVIANDSSWRLEDNNHFVVYEKRRLSEKAKEIQDQLRNDTGLQQLFQIINRAIKSNNKTETWAVSFDRWSGKRDIEFVLLKKTRLVSGADLYYVKSARGAAGGVQKNQPPDEGDIVGSPHSGKNILSAYLENIKSAAMTLRESKTTKPILHIVMGNEASDLDSMVASIAYAYVESQKPQTKGQKPVLFLPLMNIPQEDFRLRTEAVYLFKQLGISEDNLLFTDTLDINELNKQGFDIHLMLVDHNNLPENQKDLWPYVIEIIDHHNDEKQYNKQVNVEIAPVGSATTLIAERILKTDLLNHSPELAQFLLGPILLDTANLKEISRTTDRDRVIASSLSSLIEDSQDVFWEKLNSARVDVSSLSFEDLLRKYYKGYREGDISYGFSSIFGLTFEELMQKQTATGLENIRQRYNLDLLFGIVSYAGQEGFKRQLFIYSPNSDLLSKVKEFLQNDKGRTPALQLVDITSGLNLDSSVGSKFAAFAMSSDISRKILAPDIKEFMAQHQPPLSPEEFTPKREQLNEQVYAYEPLRTMVTRFRNAEVSEIYPEEAQRVTALKSFFGKEVAKPATFIFTSGFPFNILDTLSAYPEFLKQFENATFKFLASNEKEAGELARLGLKEDNLITQDKLQEIITGLKTEEERASLHIITTQEDFTAQDQNLKQFLRENRIWQMVFSQDAFAAGAIALTLKHIIELRNPGLSNTMEYYLGRNVNDNIIFLFAQNIDEHSMRFLKGILLVKTEVDIDAFSVSFGDLPYTDKFSEQQKAYRELVERL